MKLHDKLKKNPEVKRLFTAIDVDNDGQIVKNDILKHMTDCGLQRKDVRVAEVFETLSHYESSQTITFDDFVDIVGCHLAIVKKALEGSFIIRDFNVMSDTVADIFERVKSVKSGKVADYIPQLAKLDPAKFAVAICTVDGQQCFFGDYKDYYCLQSMCKPILYCLALEENGEEFVHRHIGREPSGEGFSELKLNKKGLPHNPMINAGAIMDCALIKSKMDASERFEYVMEQVKRLSGNNVVGFDNAVYLSEREHADRNFALGYFMKEHCAFPHNTNLLETLEFYFQCCSIELNTSGMAALAATLANGGNCPITNADILKPDTVKNCLSLMYSCGMYDYSGEWAFTMGIPAKSGVSGGIMAVVPGVLGMCVWSPPLDELGNSARGIEFYHEFIDEYNFHNYDSLLTERKKTDPRYRKDGIKRNTIFALLSAASEGDLHEVVRIVASGVKVVGCDYDGRTPLHLAASNGCDDVLRYLLSKKVNPCPKDRWGGTPLDDAEREGHESSKKILQSYIKKYKKPKAKK
ncbi:MAG: glutaminase A [Coxiellaceae bacterium]|nr:glutaminase A [Coxiellaceae bacterium]